MISDRDLLSHFREPAAQSDGSWTAFCPAHLDGAKHGNRSLHISRNSNKWLFKCFNDCTAEAIAAAAGLAVADLFDEPKSHRPRLAVARKALTPKQMEQWWLAARPLAGSLAEIYLRSRGIVLDFSRLLTLRFLPEAPYYAQGKKNAKAHYPCMVAAVGDLNGVIIGIHRTYLAPTGLGKAPEDSPKKMMGAVTPWGVRLSPPACGTLRIGEGIETILSVATAKGLGEAQYVAALSAEGLKAWEGPEHDAIELYADHDPAGQKAADALAVTEKLAGRRACIFLPPAAGQDFNDVLRNEPEALAAIQGEEREVEAEERLEAGKPVLLVSNYGLETLGRQAWAAIEHRNNPPWIFTRDYKIVRVNDVIHPIQNVYEFRYEMARAARWEKETPTGATVETLPPLDLCHDMMADLHPKLPTLRRLVPHWIIDRQGRFVTEAGYDRESQLYLTTDKKFEPIPMTVADGIALFDDLLSDFHWDNPRKHRAHAFALMILPFIREYIHDLTPVHGIEATDPGTGKGLLTAVLLAVAGISKGFSPPINKPEDLMRHLESALLSSRELIVLDNLPSDFNSGILNSILTTDAVPIRPLYQQILIEARQELIWITIGNQPFRHVEYDRRVVPIRITSPVERPYERQDIKDPELETTFRRRRRETMSAVWSILKAWSDAGRPEKNIRWSSFNRWARVMGGILEVAEIPGFLEQNDKEFRAEDAERSKTLKFLTSWSKGHGSRWMAAKELLSEAVYAEIFLGKSDKDESRTWHLGKVLGGMRGQTIGSFKVLHEHDRIRGNQYSLIEVAAAENRGNKDEELPF